MVKPINHARAEYMKQWRKKHPDKISQYNKQYWERRALREQKQQKEMQDHGSGKAFSNN